ncbi:PET112 (YBL080C) [Zygosaccharomyces parabailii]|nr:PET112 (YBL080C) [Zygosaccharomyces parabailii]CDH14253.1 probable Glutamyl-tRNA(Gln) amidotransferase subunit B, mitochondrial [Zygosaccharomyces bailii ISA1307]
MWRAKRLYHVSVSPISQFKPLPQFKLKCGLEIHTQLSTKNKLFSLSFNDPFRSADTPNLHTTFFDLALPGTQPLLNYEAIVYAAKLALSLESNVNLNSQFDRKHYFYGDQPLGYQITQHYSPFASGGHLSLLQNIDDIDEKVKDIRITQLQIEQDTGKSLYRKCDQITLVDLNRSNVPLVELVTEPDFENLKQIKAFLKKYQNLVRHLGVSTGDLESGAMRVDVNLSINDHARVELKNLPNTSSIMNAIKYEYQRQVTIMRDGKAEEMLSKAETRGWTGSSTVKLRSKETTIDYRYMPDTELPRVALSPDVITNLQKTMPPLPDEVLKGFVNAPYFLTLKDAKKLCLSSNGQGEIYNHAELQKYYVETFKFFVDCVKSRTAKMRTHISKLPTNWIIHELLGDLNKLQLPLSKAAAYLTPRVFADFLMLIHDAKISSSSGKLLLFHILKNFKESNYYISQPVDFDSLIDDYDMKLIKQIDPSELKQICRDIIEGLNNEKLINDIVSGRKKNSIKYLVGQGMKLSQGRIQAQEFEKTFKDILNVKW